MRSRTTRTFRGLLAALPTNVREQAREAYKIFAVNPWHPGLRFKRVHDDPVIYSARVGIGHRAVGTFDGDEVVWFWIGTHANYDLPLKQL